MIASRAKALIVGTLLLAPAATHDASPVPRPRMLEVVTGGHAVWRGAVAEGEALDLSFIHSSERCRWTQHLHVRRDAIEQSASTFSCFGPGMPVWTPATRRSAEGYTVPAHLRLAAIPMVNWRPAAITLRYRGQTLAIGEWIDDWARFDVRVR